MEKLPTVEKKSLLIVDDEPGITKTLSRLFRGNFVVFTASSADEGFKILNENPVQVIISDQRMPEKTGVEFFAEVKKQFPNIIRIMLTGYTDIDDVVESINKGNVFKYVSKPWDPDNLNSIINDAFAVYDSQEKDRLHIGESRFSTIFYNSPLAIALTSMETNQLIQVNPAWQKITGYTDNEAFGKTVNELKLFVNPQMFSELISEINKHGKLSDFEFQLRKKTGEIRDLVFYAELIELEGESHMLSMAMDITERKKVEIELFKAKEKAEVSEEKANSILNSLTASVAVIDEKGNILEVNDTWIEFAKNNSESHQKVPYLEYNYFEVCKRDEGDKDAIAVYKGLKDLFNKKLDVFDHEYQCDSPDEKRWFLMRAIKMKGKQKQVVISHIDISKRRLIEQQLSESEENNYKIMISAEEKERERYAKELHDGLGPLLSTSMIYLQTAIEEESQKKQADYLNRTFSLLEDASQSIREISTNLSPAILQEYGLIQGVRAFIEKLTDVTDIKFIMQSKLNIRFSEVIEFTLYRVIIELINNSIKHANAKEIRISIQYSDNRLNIVFLDDGKGFDYILAKESNTGFGLKNIDNRLQKLGAKYNVESSEGEGLKVSISMNTDIL